MYKCIKLASSLDSYKWNIKLSYIVEGETNKSKVAWMNRTLTGD